VKLYIHSSIRASCFGIKLPLIIPTKFKIFIFDIHLLYLSYVFRCHIKHHQEELSCHLLTTRYCNEAINYGFSSSYVVNYKM
jgi:hypothetical protein